MIDITREKLIPLAEIPGLNVLPKRRRGSRIATSTLYRWAMQGVRGCRLETVCIGSQRCTSIMAIQRFFSRLGGVPSDRGGLSPSSRRDPKRHVESVDKELDRLGLGGTPEDSS
jgi:hypothetical protein